MTLLPTSLPVSGVRVLLCALLSAVPSAGAVHEEAPRPLHLPAHHRQTPAPPAPRHRWEWPLAGHPRPLRGFAPPPQPWLAGHRGVDLIAVPGSEVRAAGAGRVGYSGPLAGRGVVTVLHPGDLRTTYLPVRPVVRHGQAVRRGEVIGTLQDVPGHCPTSCLHWGLLHDRLYLDPLLLLGRGRVRLLPPPPPPPPPSPSAPPGRTPS